MTGGQAFGRLFRFTVCPAEMKREGGRESAALSGRRDGPVQAAALACLAGKWVSSGERNDRF